MIRGKLFLASSLFSGGALATISAEHIPVFIGGITALCGAILWFSKMVWTASAEKTKLCNRIDTLAVNVNDMKTALTDKVGEMKSAVFRTETRMEKIEKGLEQTHETIVAVITRCDERVRACDRLYGDAGKGGRGDRVNLRIEPRGQ
jgi:hypothetical protein